LLRQQFGLGFCHWECFAVGDAIQGPCKDPRPRDQTGIHCTCTYGCL